MKPYILLPRYINAIGWLLAVAGLILGVAYLYFDYQFTPRPAHYKIKTSTDCTNEVALTLLLLGFYTILFSRMKAEDGTVNEIRLNAIYWAFLVNCLLMTLCAYVYMLHNVLTEFWVYNLFSMAGLAVGRYYYSLWIYRKTGAIKRVKLLNFHPYYTIGLMAFITGAILSVVLYLIDNEDKWFYVLPMLGIFWFCTSEQNEEEGYVSRLKTVLKLFALQLLVTLFCNFFYYYIDFLFFMVINQLLFPLGYLLLFKVYRLVIIKKGS